MTTVRDKRLVNVVKNVINRKMDRCNRQPSPWLLYKIVLSKSCPSYLKESVDTQERMTQRVLIKGSNELKFYMDL